MRYFSYGLCLSLSYCAPANRDDNRNPGGQVGKPTANTFTDKINPIITKSCGGGTCHGAGSSNGTFIGNETFFRSKATKIALRVGSADNSKMPPQNSGRVLASSDKDTILKYLRDEGLIDTKPPGDTSANSGSGTKSNEPTPQPSTTPTTSNLSYECRSGVTIDSTKTKPDFDGTINPILMNSCSGSTCHSDANSGRKLFVGSGTTLQATDTAVLYKLKNSLMPIGGKTISPADKQLIYQFLCTP